MPPLASCIEGAVVCDDVHSVLVGPPLEVIVALAAGGPLLVVAVILLLVHPARRRPPWAR